MSYCDWSGMGELMRAYHDEEWGVPVRDDRRQFEFLMMEVMQCGLNWKMMLDKREIFRRCFAGFDYEAVAEFGEEDVERILSTPGMIRSRRKAEAVISDARHFIEIRDEFGSFTDYIWSFTGGKTIIYEGHAEGYIPASNGLSERISRDLKKRGFKYLGGVTVYSHLQAAGLICDHAADCPCRKKVLAMNESTVLPRDEEKNVVCFGQKEE